MKNLFLMFSLLALSACAGRDQSDNVMYDLVLFNVNAEGDGVPFGRTVAKDILPRRDGSLCFTDVKPNLKVCVKTQGYQQTRLEYPKH